MRLLKKTENERKPSIESNGSSFVCNSWSLSAVDSELRRHEVENKN
jgi:hypothetical protein